MKKKIYSIILYSFCCIKVFSQDSATYLLSFKEAGKLLKDPEKHLLYKSGSFFYFANYRRQRSLYDSIHFVKNTRQIMVVNADTFFNYSNSFDFYIRRDINDKNKCLIFIRTKLDSFFTYPCSNYFYTSKSNMLGGMADFFQTEGNSIGESKFVKDTFLIINGRRLHSWVIQFKFWNYLKNAYSPERGYVYISSDLLIPLEIRYLYKNISKSKYGSNELIFRIESIPERWWGSVLR
jgi:hypothetical protein